MFQIVSGNLLDENCWKLHQTNCTSKGVRGIAAAIFGKWPETNTYFGQYACERKFGRIDIFPKYRVINMNAQLHPGGPNMHVGDGIKDRLAAFENTLRLSEEHIANHHGGSTTLAFPYGIGCGLAKGDWMDYLGMIHDSYERFQGIYQNASILYRVVRLK